MAAATVVQPGRPRFTVVSGEAREPRRLSPVAGVSEETAEPTVAASAPIERDGGAKMKLIDRPFRELDDLVLHLKGLVLVRDLRRQRGADDDELDMYRVEIERARDRLARFAREGALPQLA